MRLLPTQPPPGPARPEFWKSPLRGPWLTAALGSLLLIGVAIVALTGFLSHAAYEPGLPGNAIVDPSEDVDLFPFDWPASPSWLYALTQGLHVTVGIMTVPLLLAKLWSVIPRLFAWPPFSSPAMLIERLTLALLVGSSLFQFATGVVNIQLFYVFHFNFTKVHYWGAWVFVVSLAVHVGVKLTTIRDAYRINGVIRPLKAKTLAQTAPEPVDAHGLVAVAPEPPTITRRSLFGVVGGASALLGMTTAGQSIGGPLRDLALLAPRREAGDGPNGFPVNKTARTAGIRRGQLDGWALELNGGRKLTRDELLAMQLVTAKLPIACVEGWTTRQAWTGVRLRDLARLAGVEHPRGVRVESLQEHGAFRIVSLNEAQCTHEHALLALQVNGADLSLDHGFPARIIVPALPGVHNTKWVRSLTFAT